MYPLNEDIMGKKLNSLSHPLSKEGQDLDDMLEMLTLEVP